MPNQTDQLINVQLQQLAAQVANWAAQLDFAKERFRLLELPEFQARSQLEIDRLAFEKAQDTWKRAFQESSLTGMYNGQPTLEWLTQQAQLTGVLNGQQTLQGKLTDAQIAQMNEQMRLANEQFLVNTTGYHQGRPTFEREQFATQQTGYYNGQSTLARQQMEAELSGYFGGRQTLEREKFGADQTQNYLQLLASLQGPGNAFKQMRVLGATPENLQNLVSGWAGTYGMPGFGSTGAPGQAQISDLWMGAGTGQAANPVGNTGPAGMPGQWAAGSTTTDAYGNVVAPGGAPSYAQQTATAPGAAPVPPGSTMQPGYTGLPPLPGAPTLPTYRGPAGGPVPPVPGEMIPGRGFSPDQWNPATKAAVAEWEARHPGFKLDGSQQGWYQDPNFGVQAPWTPTTPTNTPGAGGGGGLSPEELNEYEQILQQEAATIGSGQTSLLQPGSALAARLTEFLNRGAQYQSASPIPGSPQAIQNALRFSQYVASTGPWNAGRAAELAPKPTAFTWTPGQQAPGPRIDAPPQPPLPPAGTNTPPTPFGITDPGFDPNAGQSKAQGAGAGFMADFSATHPVYGQAASGMVNGRPWYVQPEQYAQWDALPTETKQQYIAGMNGASYQSAAQTPGAYGSIYQTATNGMQTPGYTYSPQGVQAPPGAYNYSATGQGHTQVYPPGVTAPANQEQVSTQTPVTNSTANSLLANPMPGMGGSLSPSQMNAKAYNNLNPYAQEFLWAQFEDQGWDIQAAKGEFMKSLPKYSGPSKGTVTI